MADPHVAKCCFASRQQLAVLFAMHRDYQLTRPGGPGSGLLAHRRVPLGSTDSSSSAASRRRMTFSGALIDPQIMRWSSQGGHRLSGLRGDVAASDCLSLKAVLRATIADYSLLVPMLEHEAVRRACRFALASFSMADRLPVAASYASIEAPLAVMLAEASVPGLASIGLGGGPEATLTGGSHHRPLPSSTSSRGLGTGSAAGDQPAPPLASRSGLCDPLVSARPRLKLMLHEAQSALWWLPGRLSELSACAMNVIQREIDLDDEVQAKRVQEEMGLIEVYQRAPAHQVSLGGGGFVSALEPRAGMPVQAMQRAAVSGSTRCRRPPSVEFLST